MARDEQKRTKGGEPSDEELKTQAIEVVRQARALNRTQLRKRLPSAFKKHHEKILANLRSAVRSGELFGWQTARAEWFFSVEPIAALDAEARQSLDAGPLLASELKKRVVAASGLPGGLFDEWKKTAAARGVVFPARPGEGSRAKWVGKDPDPALALGRSLPALRIGVRKLLDQGLSAPRIALWLLAEIGLGLDSSEASSSSTTRDEESFLAGLKELTEQSPRGALLSLGELRGRVALDKERFDRAAVSLFERGAIVLHHHDYAAGLDASARDRLVADGRGNHYVGVALRAL